MNLIDPNIELFFRISTLNSFKIKKLNFILYIEFRTIVQNFNHFWNENNFKKFQQTVFFFDKTVMQPLLQTKFIKDQKWSFYSPKKFLNHKNESNFMLVFNRLYDT